MSPQDKVSLIEKILEPLYTRLKNCDICPRNCKIDRLLDKKGFCGGGKDAAVYASFLHCGEEPAISGERGSGTIFFSGCNLKCVYCQNYQFSQAKGGKFVNQEELAEVMLSLENEGAHNINLVTPTHFLPQILKALLIALKKGFNLPIVYNTSGYEKVDVITQLEGIADIYLTDFRYISENLAKNYSDAQNYPQFACESIKEMYRQCPDAKWEGNILKQGLVIRQLLLPGNCQESKDILNWIKQNTPKALVGMMFQYQPYFKASNYPEINRSINQSEYQEIVKFVEELDLESGWIQEFSPLNKLAGVHFKPGQKKHI